MRTTIVISVLVVAALATVWFYRSRMPGAIPNVHRFKAKVTSGPSPIPLIVYGHQASSTAAAIAGVSTLACVAVDDLTALQRVIENEQAVGILAMSRTTAPGEAGQAIALFRKQSPQGMALYAAWDYNVARAAARAIEYHADGIMMPGIDGDEMFRYLFGVLERVEQGKPRLTSVAEHEALVKELAPTSPFWRNQNLVVSPHF